MPIKFVGDKSRDQRLSLSPSALFPGGKNKRETIWALSSINLGTKGANDDVEMKRELRLIDSKPFYRIDNEIEFLLVQNFSVMKFNFAWW